MTFLCKQGEHRADDFCDQNGGEQGKTNDQSHANAVSVLIQGVHGHQLYKARNGQNCAEQYSHANFLPYDFPKIGEFDFL